jgi:formylglycine-generating enzyme required for sulfatase activity
MDRESAKVGVGTEPQVFVSYAQDDAQQVREVVHMLKHAQVAVWRDGDRIFGGQGLAKKIKDGIVNSRVVLLMCSPRAFESRYVRREVALSWECDRPIIAVWLTPRTEFPAEIHLYVAGDLYFDAYAQPTEVWLPQLLKALEAFGIQPRRRARSKRKKAPDPAKEIANSIGMKLKLIPAGEFLMGSPDSDKDANPNEKPQHPVRITRPFYLGIYPVTQREYMEVTKTNPSHLPSGERHPVESVSWLDAAAFCNALSQKEGLKPFYAIQGDAVEVGDWSGPGYRLPTEAEWEYACRAGSQTRYCFSDDEKALGKYAWYSANSNDKTHPVGEKKPNAFGLHDMHGNVWEWCWDGYGADYYESSPVDDPRGPDGASDRVIRGGGWYSKPRICRSAYRDWNEPGYRYNDLGFRLALSQSGR